MKDTIAIMAMCATALLATPSFAQDRENFTLADQPAGNFYPLPGMESSMTSIQNEMNRLFGDFYNTHAFGDSRPILASTPAVNIVNEGKEFVATVSLPGVALKDIDAEIVDGALIVKSSEDMKVRNETKNYIRQESSITAFQREIPLPDTADVNNAKAVYKNGMLMVTLPKSTEAKPLSRRLVIKPSI